jgi:MFS family permease
MILAAFLLDFAVSCGLVATPFFAYEHFKAGPGVTGTVGAMQMALYAVGCLVSAQFMRGGHHGVGWAFGGVTTFALLYCLVPATGDQFTFGLVASVPFLGLALAWPAMQAWIGGEPNPEARARHLSGFNTATAFGFTLSPLVAGPLFDLDHRIPFAALAMLCTAVVALLLSLLVGTARSRDDGHNDDSDASQSSVSVDTGLLYASWCATLTANGLVTAVRSVYPMRIESLSSNRELTLVGSFRPSWIESVGAATSFSWLAFLLSLGTVVCFMILGRTSSWQRRFELIVAGQVAAAVSFTLLGHARSLALQMICFVVVGANFGLCFFSSLHYSLAAATEKHRRAAINEGALGVGGFIGGVGVGYFAERSGVTHAFLWTPVAVCAAVCLQVLLLKRYRTRKN